MLLCLAIYAFIWVVTAHYSVLVFVLQELLKLRKKITSTVQVLTHLKEKLQYVQAENQVQKRNLREVEQDVGQVMAQYANTVKSFTVVSWAQNFVVWRWWTCSWTLEFVDLQITHKITLLKQYVIDILNSWIFLPAKCIKLNVWRINIILQ